MVFGNDDSFVDRHSEMKIIEIVQVLVQSPLILFNLVQSHAKYVQVTISMRLN